MKFHDVVGFKQGDIETVAGNGVWEEQIVERWYSGDVTRSSRQIQNADKVNFDMSVSNTVSIVADPFANESFAAIRYCRWMGALWIVTNVEPKRPRLHLTLGGVYNGVKGTTPSDPWSSGG